MRLGLFGGSFDPVHRGHLALAASCLEQSQLDRVWFVPAAQQPFKPSGPHATNAARLAMLKLALADHGAFEISELEIDRGGLSYTFDTLLSVEELLPDAKLFLLLGADSLVDFPHWRRPAEICRVATPLVVNRAGEPAPDFQHLTQIVSPERLAEIKANQIEMPPLAISSSEIRQLIANGGEWEEMVPERVADYIREHRLYKTR
jgi:nicotinate-nucleotide adenylyltransferase